MKPFTIFSIALLITILMALAATFFVPSQAQAETCSPGNSLAEVRATVTKSAEKNGTKFEIGIVPEEDGQKLVVAVYSSGLAIVGIFSKDDCLVARPLRTKATDEMMMEIFGKTLAELFPAPAVDS